MDAEELIRVAFRDTDYDVRGNEEYCSIRKGDFWMQTAPRDGMNAYQHMIHLLVLNKMITKIEINLK